MTNREVFVYIASILTTIADSERDGLPVPLGPMSAAMIGRIDFGEGETLMGILVVVLVILLIIFLAKRV